MISVHDVFISIVVWINYVIIIVACTSPSASVAWIAFLLYELLASDRTATSPYTGISKVLKWGHFSSKAENVS